MGSEFATASAQLIHIGHRIAAKGLVPATSGNFSLRLPDGSIAITRSGADKGALTTDTIMRVDAAGKSLDERRPSAETLLHTQLYQHYPKVNAVLHTHSVNATVLSLRFPGGISLTQYELLKALPDISSHEAELFIPVVANDQDIPRLALQVATYLQQQHNLCAYLIAGHGLYTWGANLNQTYNHIEALEFLLTCELHKRG